MKSDERKKENEEQKTNGDISLAAIYIMTIGNQMCNEVVVACRGRIRGEAKCWTTTTNGTNI